MSPRRLLGLSLSFWFLGCAGLLGDEKDTGDAQDDDSGGGGGGDTDSGNTGPVDSDGDAYASDVDCDDTNPAIHPGGTEVCDAADADEDCDGFTDDDDPQGATGGTSFYLDSDGDGYGDMNGGTTLACDPGPGHAGTADDCDDTDATVNPAANEVCDAFNVDENCNGVADDADDYATGQSTWYRDADGDDFGTPLDSTQTCDQPAGYIADDSDCNDGNYDINPDGVEICDDADEDEDCDGYINDDDVDMSDDGLNVWYRDSDRDGYGDPSTTVNACDAPSGYVEDANDCDDTSSSVTPAATEVCDDGLDNDCDGTPNSCGISGTFGLSRGTAEAKIYGESSSDYLANANGLAPAGDLNNDGYDDFVVGAYYADGAASTSGEAYVFYGPVSGFASVATADSILQGATASDGFGVSVLGGFDANADGKDDVAVGAPYRSSYDPGAVYIYYSSLSATETSADLTYSGTSTSYGYVGSALGAGDVNADGKDDLVIGASGEGYVYVIQGKLSTTSTTLSSASAILSESGVGGEIAVGDTNGDGRDDIALGDAEDSTSDTNAGTVYFVEGAPSGTIVLDTSADAWFVGEDRYDYAGASVALDGDANDDGYADLVMGATQEDAGGSESGAVYIQFGPLTGYNDLSTADVKLYGEGSDDYCGSAVSWVGDMSGDGRDDLLVGCYSEDSAASSAGAAYVLYGTVVTSGSLSIADAKLQGESSSDYAGISVSGAGDTDGDGTSDILVGAYSDDDGGSGAGAIYLLLGGGM